MNAMLEPRMVAARIQGPFTVSGRSQEPARIAPSSHGGLAMSGIVHSPTGTGRICGLAPAAAQRAIELHHGHAFLQAQLRQSELAVEEVALRVQHLEVAIQAAAIAQFRESYGVFQRVHQLLLLAALLPQTVETDQGVG